MLFDIDLKFNVKYKTDIENVSIVEKSNRILVFVQLENKVEIFEILKGIQKGLTWTINYAPDNLFIADRGFDLMLNEPFLVNSDILATPHIIKEFKENVLYYMINNSPYYLYHDPKNKEQVFLSYYDSKIKKIEVKDQYYAYNSYLYNSFSVFDKNDILYFYDTTGNLLKKIDLEILPDRIRNLFKTRDLNDIQLLIPEKDAFIYSVIGNENVFYIKDHQIIADIPIAFDDCSEEGVRGSKAFSLHSFTAKKMYVLNFKYKDPFIYPIENLNYKRNNISSFPISEDLFLILETNDFKYVKTRILVFDKVACDIPFVAMANNWFTMRNTDKKTFGFFIRNLWEKNAFVNVSFFDNQIEIYNIKINKAELIKYLKPLPTLPFRRD